MLSVYALWFAVQPLATSVVWANDANPQNAIPQPELNVDGIEGIEDIDKILNIWSICFL